MPINSFNTINRLDIKMEMNCGDAMCCGQARTEF